MWVSCWTIVWASSSLSLASFFYFSFFTCNAQCTATIEVPEGKTWNTWGTYPPPNFESFCSLCLTQRAKVRWKRGSHANGVCLSGQFFPHRFFGLLFFGLDRRSKVRWQRNSHANRVCLTIFKHFLTHLWHPRYGGNATHMPTEFVAPDDNQHEGWCSGDWTLGMISDKVIHANASSWKVCEGEM